MQELLSFICSFIYLLFSFPYWCCYGIMYKYLDLYGWFLGKSYNQEQLELYSWYLLVGFGCLLFLIGIHFVYVDDKRVKQTKKYYKDKFQTTVVAVNKECRELIEEKAALKKQLKMWPSKEEDIVTLDNIYRNTTVYDTKALAKFRYDIKLEIAKLKDQIQAIKPF